MNPELSRRQTLAAGSAFALGLSLPSLSLSQASNLEGPMTMSTVTTPDGVEIFYKDWGPKDAQPIMFHHGWPLSSDDWDAQMLFFVQNGYRVVAHDRRGHGRSAQVSDGHDMDHYAADAFAVVETLDLTNAVHIGHSTGGGEVARYVAQHGQPAGRVAKAVLVSAVPPLMLKTLRTQRACRSKYSTAFGLPWPATTPSSSSTCQEVEGTVAVRCINRFTALGMPHSVRIT